MAAAAASRGIAAKLGLREIRIHLCQRSPGSQGVSIWPREECLFEQLQCGSGNQSPGECAKWQSLKLLLRSKSNSPTAWALLDWVQCGQMCSSVLYKAWAENAVSGRSVPHSTFYPLLYNQLRQSS
nr:NADH dehydrogenase [ubiquinone] 1 alpha subcomplex subunit 2 isoform X1 [Vicugna pacos]